MRKTYWLKNNPTNFAQKIYLVELGESTPCTKLLLVNCSDGTWTRGLYIPINDTWLDDMFNPIAVSGWLDVERQIVESSYEACND